jgi:exonuclease III
MISLTIFLILISQNVETNPGPLSDKPSFKIISYNCNGLGNPIKVKRLLHKLEATVNNNGIVFLQETHIVNSNYVKLIWKNSFISNCVKTNSAGVIILFNNQMKIIEKSEDEEGRLIVAVIENEERKLIVVNAYYPNDHKEGIKFAEKMYLNILEMQTKYPEHLVISAGDYNVCMTENDLLNRKRTKTEQLLAENLVENNKIAKLKDAFREKQPKNGFTWKRGNCYSRLDHIFVSEELIPHVKNAILDWCLDKSDHAAVIIEIVEENPTIRGPGIVKLNTKTLEDPTVVREIENEVKQMMDQTDESWNSHAKLEFLKVAIRSIVSAKTSKIRREIKEDFRDCEEEINQMENLNIKIITDQSNNEKKRRSKDLNMLTVQP